ncbi:LEA type 2 family protein [Lysobacter sp. K5869]|uniref:NDR1/HIN1-like protein n=1 Tax=Lysobacter sp. K5869 TaxID=2820808 RepID=UPI001C05F499|nr:LEA type 2 family protein [Lysobacter sp. K5869]QWP79085.1 LEA type 2 family protein [Lysobacter sp. K5869]
MKAGVWVRVFGAALVLASLAACKSGPVRRVSEPAARIQQLTVKADGSWSVDLRLENFSSIPMQFDRIDLQVKLGEEAAGQLQTQPALSIGPESADVVTVALKPAAGAKLAIADALAGGRSVAYSLKGDIVATPSETKQRTFQVERSSALSPAPGLPGVMR